MNRLQWWGLFVIGTCLLLVEGCVVDKKMTTTPTIDWSQKKPIERVVAMRSGIFKRMTADNQTMVTQAGDSLLMMVSPVGDPLKDGYWIYQELSMANLPEHPLISVLIKFERLSPDTITAQLYNLPEQEEGEELKYYAGSYFDAKRLSNMELDKLERRDECTFYFVKQSVSEFGGTMAPCPNTAGDQFATMDIFLDPNIFSLNINVWTVPDSNNVFQDMKQIFKRQDVEYYRNFFEELKKTRGD